MKNEEYNIKLAAYIEQLQELRKEAVLLATGIIGETLCMDDLFFCASVDRCIRLIDGLIPMLRDRNLTCVSAYRWITVCELMLHLLPRIEMWLFGVFSKELPSKV